MCGYNILGGACILLYFVSALGFHFSWIGVHGFSLSFFCFLYDGYLGYLKGVHKRMLDGTSELRGSGMDWFGKGKCTFILLTFLDPDFPMFEVLWMNLCMYGMVWYTWNTV